MSVEEPGQQRGPPMLFQECYFIRFAKAPEKTAANSFTWKDQKHLEETPGLLISKDDLWMGVGTWEQL